MPKTIYHPAYRNTLRKLRAARMGRRITGAELGRRLGKGHAWCQKIESGQLRLDVLHYVLVCRALGLRADRLVREMEKELQDEDGALFSYRRIVAGNSIKRAVCPTVRRLRR